MAPQCPARPPSSPLPVSFAFNRNGEPHMPATDPSNCAGPSLAATARSSPSSASKMRLRSDDSFVSRLNAVRRSASRSIPPSADNSGIAVSVALPLSCGASRSSDGGRDRAIGPRLVLAEIERQLGAHGPRTRSHRIEPRGKRRRERRNQRGELTAATRRVEIERQLSGQTGAIEIAATFQRYAIGLDRSSTGRARKISDRSRASPRTAATPDPPKWRGRCRATAALRSGQSPCGPASERAGRPRHRDRDAPPFNSASKREPPPAGRFDSAIRPSTAPPSISAFMASIAKPPAATLTLPRRRSGFWLR